MQTKHCPKCFNTFTRLDKLFCNYCRCTEQECDREILFRNLCSLHVPRCIICDCVAICHNNTCEKHAHSKTEKEDIRIRWGIYNLICKTYALSSDRISIHHKYLIGKVLHQSIRMPPDVFFELLSFM